LRPVTCFLSAAEQEARLSLRALHWMALDAMGMNVAYSFSARRALTRLGADGARRWPREWPCLLREGKTTREGGGSGVHDLVFILGKG
jgi:hypothetical protein